MNHGRNLLAAMSAAVFAMAMGGHAVAQSAKPLAQGKTIPPPEYGSTFKSGNYNTPESDARPGVHFFHYAWVALQKGDVRHAIDMYQVSASWAFKPADYMLALIYFRGDGVAVDRPLGAVWMRLAAERDAPLFVRARDAMNGLLSKSQRIRAEELWNRLRPEYGDAYALKKAASRWSEVMGHSTLGDCAATGWVQSSHPGVGGSMEVPIGRSLPAGAKAMAGCANVNPYSSIFLRNPDNPMFQKGIRTVTVGPLQKVDKNGKPSSEKQPKPTPPGVHDKKGQPVNQQIP